MKEKQIYVSCSECLHHFACLVNSEYVPTPCPAYEEKANRKQSEGEDTNVPTKWISVEDRLPDHCGMPVLMVAVNSYDQTRIVKGFTDYQCPITFHTNEREYDGTWGAWDVTHWMPLPDAPKGDEKE